MVVRSGKLLRTERSNMTGVTAKDLMKAQAKRLKRQQEKEAESKVTEDMRFRFQRKPYYMTVGKGDVKCM